MSDSRDSIIKMYEGALRALDTKSQIFLAFLVITVPPVFGRLENMGMPFWARVVEGVCVAGATLAFVLCLFPRRGRRSSHGLFDINLKGLTVAALLKDAGYSFDAGEPIAALHDIYRIKAQLVMLGTGLIAAYILSVAVSFAMM